MENKMLSPKNDFIFKLIFGDNRNIDILADFLKSVLNISHDEYEKLTIVDPHLKPEGIDDKLGILDVKIHTKTGKLINVEIQILEIPQMPERILFYTSKMITEQISTGNNYDTIKKVISIVILNYNLIKDNNNYHNVYRLYDKNTNSQFTDLLEINTLELLKLPKETDNTELFNWLSFLKAEREEDYAMIAEKSPTISKAVGILKELSQDERTRLIYESQEKRRRDEASRLNGAVKNATITATKNTTMNFVKKALVNGFSIEDITKITDLTYEEIQQISKELENE